MGNKKMRRRIACLALSMSFGLTLMGTTAFAKTSKGEDLGTIPSKEEISSVLKDGKYKIDIKNLIFRCSVDDERMKDAIKENNILVEENGYMKEEGAPEKFGLDKTLILEVKDSKITTYYNVKEFDFFGDKVYPYEFMSGSLHKIEEIDEIVANEAFSEVVSKDSNGIPETLSFTGNVSLKNFCMAFKSEQGEDYGMVATYEFELDFDSFDYYSENGNVKKMSAEEKKNAFDVVFSEGCLDEDVYQESNEENKKVIKNDNKVSESKEKNNTNVTATKKPENSKLDNSPKTGDSSSTGLIIACVVGGVAIISLVVIIILKKKKDK